MWRKGNKKSLKEHCFSTFIVFEVFLNIKENHMNESSIPLSIIIPVYNVNKYLSEMVSSVLDQTYKNFEIILIDDGSKDGSSEICDVLVKKDNRIRVIHQKNKGVSEARNKGLQNSKGKYILFLDADDLINEKMVEKLIYPLINESFDMTCCGYYEIFDDKTLNNIPDFDYLFDKNKVEEELFKDPGFFSAVWNKMFKKESLLDENGNLIMFDPSIAIGEDTLWLSKIIKNVKKIKSVKEALYIWRRREDSATKGEDLIRIDNKFLSLIDSYKKILKEVENDKIQKLVLKRYLGLTRDCLILAYKINEKQIEIELYNRLKAEKANLLFKKNFFNIKLSICLFLVRIHAPVSVIEMVNGVKKG